MSKLFGVFMVAIVVLLAVSVMFSVVADEVVSDEKTLNSVFVSGDIREKPT